MTAEEYRNYLEQDFSDVDINEMTDLRMIKADRNKSLQERRDIFLNKDVYKRQGNSTTTPRDLENDLDVWIIQIALAESVAARLR